VKAPRWLVVLGALATGPCGPEPTMADLACSDDVDCARWGLFAPFCLDGVCSQCAIDPDCGDDEFCEPNVDGFGTCLPGARP